jgi:hypothetical protein
MTTSCQQVIESLTVHDDFGGHAHCLHTGLLLREGETERKTGG